MGDELAQRLPVAVVRCGDSTQRERLEASARANRVLYVPVVTPPTSTGLHVLEVYVAGDPSPTLLLGEPLGPPTSQGSPFRLRTMTGGGSSARLTSVGRAPHRSGATPTQPGARATEAPARATEPAAADAHVEDADDAFVGRTLAAGKLRIEARVGEGGAGTVYRARHRDLQMDVAVKVMHDSFQRDPEFCRRFHAEALSASRLDHTNLTRVLDFGQEPDGLLYIAMEFLDGRTLRDLLEREGRVDFPRAAQLMAQVCSGLTHAHARSIIHRDIKPENLVLVRGLDDDGRETEIVKVCDFGIAHRSAVETEAIFAGTAEYIAPELFRGDPPDVQSDVYACGVVLYELLTGRVPIEGDVPAIVPRVLQDTPDPPSTHAPGIDPRVDRLVMKALAKNREVRQASVRELRADIRVLAEEIAVFSSGGYWDEQPASVPGTRAARASQTNETNDWLERGPGYLEAMTRSMNAPPLDDAPARFSTPAARPTAAPASFHSSLPVPDRGASLRPSRGSVPDVEAGGIMRGSHVSMTPAAADATDSARAIAPFLQRLAETRDKARFASLVAPLGPRIRELVEQGHAGAAWRLCSTLELIAREPPGPQSRGPEAQQIVDVFVDPRTLAVCAEKALDGVADKDGFAKKLVARAGHRGAHALYSARLKSGVFEARERFVALLTEMDREGLAVVRAALEHLEPRLAVPGATAVAEDILRAAPDVPDDALGQILARYAKSPNATLALHATNALPRAWGARARPLLVAQIHHRDEEVAIAAMKRLRELFRVDREILGQLRPLVLGAAGARPKVRLAATDALADATPEARPAAQELLAQALDATQGSTPDVEDMVVVIASTIVTIGGDVAFVAARWRTSTTWLRTRLEAVMRRAAQR